MAANISNTFITVRHEGTPLRMPYFRNHSLNTTNEDIQLAVIAMHGSGDPIAETYLQRVENAAALVPGATDTTLIVAPQLAHFDDLEAHFGVGSVPADIMWGPHARFWGGLSRNDAVRISFFAGVDRILNHICHSGHFPNLNRIVILGHSAGGQFVNRYAASSPFQCLGISIRYIVMNPSSFLYFNEDRWKPGTSYTFEPPTAATRASYPECAADDDFNARNNYGYGLEDLYSYHDRRLILPAAMISRYRHRDIVHLVGENDNDPNDPWLATSCSAMLQGNHRLERCEVYNAYLEHFFGDRANHHFAIVPGAGHSGNQMIRSAIGLDFIFQPFNFPFMTTLADYIVVHDTSIRLRAGQNREFNITIPSDTVHSGNSRRPVLAFFADPTSDARNLRINIHLNGTRIVNYPYSGGTGRGHWEVFNHSNFRIGDTNELRFSVTSGTGSMNFSDIILWFQRNV